MIDQDIKLILDWLAKLLPTLRNSGNNWQIILNGNSGGEVKTEVKTTNLLLPSRKQAALEETRHR